MYYAVLLCIDLVRLSSFFSFVIHKMEDIKTQEVILLFFIQIVEHDEM